MIISFIFLQYKGVYYFLPVPVSNAIPLPLKLYTKGHFFYDLEYFNSGSLRCPFIKPAGKSQRDVHATMTCGAPKTVVPVSSMYCISLVKIHYIRYILIEIFTVCFGFSLHCLRSEFIANFETALYRWGFSESCRHFGFVDNVTSIPGKSICLCRSTVISFSVVYMSAT